MAAFTFWKVGPLAASVLALSAAGEGGLVFLAFRRPGDGPAGFHTPETTAPN
jgi:hypothetical protein